jgi:hypothetical protein
MLLAQLAYPARRQWQRHLHSGTPREVIEAKVRELFAQLLERDGFDGARAYVEKRSGNAWVVWHFDKWLAEREGRQSPPQPLLFEAIREQAAQASKAG